MTVEKVYFDSHNFVNFRRNFELKGGIPSITYKLPTTARTSVENKNWKSLFSGFFKILKKHKTKSLDKNKSKSSKKPLWSFRSSQCVTWGAAWTKTCANFEK